MELLGLQNQNISRDIASLQIAMRNLMTVHVDQPNQPEEDLSKTWDMPMRAKSPEKSKAGY